MLATGLLAGSLTLLVYAYAGYPLLVAFGPSWLWRTGRHDANQVTRCAVVCAAYDEEATIGGMIESALLSNVSDVEVIVVSDASRDQTEEIVARYAAGNSRVRLIRAGVRGGKNRALNVALRELRNEPNMAVIFTDANARLDRGAVARMIDRLNAGATCVVGRVVFTDATTDTANAEGLYWRYENAIKRAEGRLGRLPVANGAIFALRARDCEDLPPGVSNDLYYPLTTLGGGCEVVFDEGAVAREPATLGRAEEFDRKRRMVNRQLHGVLSLWHRLDGSTRFQLVSHKVLRWFGLPMMLAAMAGAAVLVPVHPVCWVILAGLTAPFVLAVMQVVGIQWRVGALGTHFVVVHWAALLGVADLARGEQHAMWSPPATSRGGTRQAK